MQFQLLKNIITKNYNTSLYIRLPNTTERDKFKKNKLSQEKN